MKKNMILIVGLLQIASICHIGCGGDLDQVPDLSGRYRFSDHCMPEWIGQEFTLTQQGSKIELSDNIMFEGAVGSISKEQGMIYIEIDWTVCSGVIEGDVQKGDTVHLLCDPDCIVTITKI